MQLRAVSGRLRCNNSNAGPIKLAEPKTQGCSRTEGRFSSVTHRQWDDRNECFLSLSMGPRGKLGALEKLGT